MHCIVYTVTPQDPEFTLIREEVEFDDKTDEGQKIWGYAHGWQDVKNKSRKTMGRLELLQRCDKYYAQGYLDGTRAARKHDNCLKLSEEERARLARMMRMQRKGFDAMRVYSPG